MFFFILLPFVRFVLFSIVMCEPSLWQELRAQPLTLMLDNSVIFSAGGERLGPVIYTNKEFVQIYKVDPLTCSRCGFLP
jgi:hypothetical protein